MSLYRRAPDLGTLHLKHFSLLLKFCTPHCHKKEIPAVKGGTAVAAIQEMCNMMQKYLVTKPVLICTRFGVTVVHRNSLAQNH